MLSQLRDYRHLWSTSIVNFNHSLGNFRAKAVLGLFRRYNTLTNTFLTPLASSSSFLGKGRSGGHFCCVTFLNATNLEVSSRLLNFDRRLDLELFFLNFNGWMIPKSWAWRHSVLFQAMPSCVAFFARVLLWLFPSQLDAAFANVRKGHYFRLEKFLLGWDSWEGGGFDSCQSVLKIFA